MINGKKCIGVLTSGGDSPGMNDAIRSVVRTAIRNDMVALGVEKGYTGLLKKYFVEMDSASVSNILKKGGTILGSARCKEFLDPKYREIAYQNALESGMDGLIVIGGDGSFMGAKYLSELGLPTVGVPGTIDNDIACTEYTIGFDTAMNTVVDIVDRLNDTSQSHLRCTVVEVMGRNSGHVALSTGVACGAVAIVTKEQPLTVNEIADHIFKAMKRGKHHYIIVVSEGIGQAERLARDIQSLTGIDTRAAILGHVQRGGSPTLRDRVVASEMGNYAVHLLAQNIGNRVVAMKDGKIVDYDIQEALRMHKGLDMELFRVMQEIV